MKLRQQEFCHNCNQYVVFEFDDVTDKQVIFCPNCGHEHYRELDEGTITTIRLNPQARKVYICKLPERLSYLMSINDALPCDTVKMEVEEHKVLGTDEKGNAIIEGNGAKVITQRRWGRDPKQNA